MSERVVFFPTRYQLRDDKVVRVKAEGLAGARFGIAERNETLPPSAGKDRGRQVNALPVDTVTLMESRDLADAAVHRVGLRTFRVVEECDVGLDRQRRCFRQLIVPERPEDRLTADDEDVGIASDGAGSPKDMGQLAPLHDLF
ncbi:MAG: hypothetical protein ABI635_08100 [Actinomycetota bacterium]